MSSSMASFQFGALPQPRGALMSEELELGVISDGVVSFAATARDVPTVDDNSFPLDLLRLPVNGARNGGGEGGEAPGVFKRRRLSSIGSILSLTSTGTDLGVPAAAVPVVGPPGVAVAPSTGSLGGIDDSDVVTHMARRPRLESMGSVGGAIAAIQATGGLQPGVELSFAMPPSLAAMLHDGTTSITRRRGFSTDSAAGLGLGAAPVGGALDVGGAGLGAGSTLVGDAAALLAVDDGLVGAAPDSSSTTGVSTRSGLRDGGARGSGASAGSSSTRSNASKGYTREPTRSSSRFSAPAARSHGYSDGAPMPSRTSARAAARASAAASKAASELMPLGDLRRGKDGRPLGTPRAGLGSGAHNPHRRVGAYSYAERLKRIRLFYEKRQRRVWSRSIKYDCRKKLADNRPRVKGRFVRSAEPVNLASGAGVAAASSKISPPEVVSKGSKASSVSSRASAGSRGSALRGSPSSTTPVASLRGNNSGGSAKSSASRGGRQSKAAKRRAQQAAAASAAAARAAQPPPPPPPHTPIQRVEKRRASSVGLDDDGLPVDAFTDDVAAASMPAQAHFRMAPPPGVGLGPGL